MSQHKHAAMIAEWIKDTSRRVLCRTPEEFEWTEDQYPCWHERWEYCFADQAPPKHRSSLTDDELVNIWVGCPSDEAIKEEKSIDVLRRLANAAAC